MKIHKDKRNERCRPGVIEALVAVVTAVMVVAGVRVSQYGFTSHLSGVGDDTNGGNTSWIMDVAERAAGIAGRTVYAEIASGTDGTCSWVIADDGVLTISPTDGVSGQLSGSRPWANDSYKASITKVFASTGVKAASCYQLFSSLPNCTEMDLTHLDVSQATNLQYCFASCYKLERVEGIRDWHTENVTTLTNAFAGCTSLEKIDL